MLGLHFLTAGASRGERALFITVEESTAQIERDAYQRALVRSGGNRWRRERQDLARFHAS